MALEKTALTQAKEIIERSSRIFLALTPNPSADAMASAEVLSRRLRAAGKETYSSPFTPPSQWEFLPVSALKSANSKNRDLLITVDSESPVGELRYEKRDGALVIILSPKENPIPPSAIKISETEAKTDCIITVSVPSLDALGDVFQKNPRLFFETPIIAIDHSDTNDRHGEVNLIDTSAGAVTETAWQFASVIAPGSMNKDEATLVLAGLLEKTDNLQNPDINPQTVTLAAECLNRGAKRREIAARLSHGENLPVLQLWARAVIRSRILETQGMLISLVTADDFNATNTDPDAVPAVIRHLKAHAPETEKILFLWQDPKRHEEIRAVVLVQKPEGTAALRRAVEGTVEADRLSVSEVFSSFVAAENALIPLLAA